jgi:hypothetical protein
MRAAWRTWSSRRGGWIMAGVDSRRVMALTGVPSGADLPAGDQDKCTLCLGDPSMEKQEKLDGGLTLAQGNVAMATKQK